MPVTKPQPSKISTPPLALLTRKGSIGSYNFMVAFLGLFGFLFPGEERQVACPCAEGYSHVGTHDPCSEGQCDSGVPCGLIGVMEPLVIKVGGVDYTYQTLNICENTLGATAVAEGGIDRDVCVSRDDPCQYSVVTPELSIAWVPFDQMDPQNPRIVNIDGIFPSVTSYTVAAQSMPGPCQATEGDDMSYRDAYFTVKVWDECEGDPVGNWIQIPATFPDCPPSPPWNGPLRLVDKDCHAIDVDCQGSYQFTIVDKCDNNDLDGGTCIYANGNNGIYYKIGTEHCGKSNIAMYSHIVADPSQNCYIGGSWYYIHTQTLYSDIPGTSQTIVRALPFMTSDPTIFAEEGFGFSTEGQSPCMPEL